MSSRPPLPVGIAVAPHMSGVWTWSVHTPTTRWRSIDATAARVGELAPVTGEQIALAATPGLGQLEVHLPQVLAEGASVVAADEGTRPQ